MNKKTKKILFFTDTPLSGGAELQMFLLAKFLDKKKFTPIVCLGPYPTLDKLAQNLQNFEIRTIRLAVKNKNDSKQIKLIKEIIKNEEIDLMHVHLWNPASGRFALLAGKSANIPIIVTEHDPFEINFIKNLFKKFTLENISKIIAISHDNKKLLEKLYPQHAKKIKVIHNGIDLTWWKSQFLSLNKNTIRDIREDMFNIPHSEEEDRPMKDTSLVGLTVAELHPRKGIHILLHAIQLLIKELPENKRNIRFSIAGDGPQRETLEKLIEKRGLTEYVTLLGRQKKIPHLMKSADFFVLPSVREAFGLVNLEAMISGLPVIATKTGGIPEIIENDKTGLLVTPESAEELKEAIKKLISSKLLRDHLSKSGKAEVTKNFSAEKMAKEYEKIYNSTLF